jgi:hypothetical protein
VTPAAASGPGASTPGPSPLVYGAGSTTIAEPPPRRTFSAAASHLPSGSRCTPVADADEARPDGRTGEAQHPAPGEASAGRGSGILRGRGVRSPGGPVRVLVLLVDRHVAYFTMIEVSRLSGSLSAFTWSESSFTWSVLSWV